MTGSPSTSPAAGPLQQLLAAEHLAVYAYGLIGGPLTGDALTLARQCREDHVTERATLTVRLAAAGATPTPAAAGYRLPDSADGGPSSAVAVEEQLCATALEVVQHGDGDDRALALTVLTACAVRAVRWRVLTGTTPPTVALPGLT